MKTRLVYILSFLLFSFDAYSQTDSITSNVQDSAVVQSDKQDKTVKSSSSAATHDNAVSAEILKKKADKLYSSEKYAEAIDVYKQLTVKGESSDIYYNLGNCYYRLDDIANSILWYERALLLSPGDSDIRFNLQLARTKTIDKIVPEEEIFLSRWYHSLLNMMSVTAWVWVGIVCFAFALAGFLLFFLSPNIVVRKSGFYGAILLCFLTVFSNVFAYQQKTRKENRDTAIVMQNSVVVKSTPADAGTDLFLLHSGTFLEIIDMTMKDWCQIRLSDGKEGWVPTSSIEKI